MQEFIKEDPSVEIQIVIQKIIETMGSILENHKSKYERDKDNDIEDSLKKFSSHLDLLFYIYLNWAAQGKHHFDDEMGEYNKAFDSNPFQRMTNRIFTVPELEPYSGSLIQKNMNRKATVLDNHEIFEEEGKENREFQRTKLRKKANIEKRELFFQNIPYKQIKHFNDAEINETLNNFNIFSDFWRRVPFKEK